MNSAKAATAPTPSPHSKTWRWFEQVMESLGSWLVGLIALAGVLAGRPVTAPAADYSAPIHDVGGSFVREWLVLGPIPTKDIEFDFLAEAGGEANVRPKEGDTVTTKDGTRLTWTRVRTTSHLVNLEKVFGIQDRSVAYAERQLSPTKDGMIQSLLPMPAFSETVHTDTNGVFRFVNLRPGKYRLPCHGPDEYVYPEGKQELDASEPIVVEPRSTREGINFVSPEAKKGVWANYPIRKGLVDLNPRSIHRTPGGMLWVGTDQATLHAYDGVEFETFSSPEIPGNHVYAIEQDAGGTLWIGSSGGIGRKVDGRIQTLSFGDSLPRKDVTAIATDRDGAVWFGTLSGLCKYDGRKFVTFTVKDGLPSNCMMTTIRGQHTATLLANGKVLVAGGYNGLTGSYPTSAELYLGEVTPNTAPTFIGATTTLNLSVNPAATDIRGLLHTSDTDSGQTLTWTQISAPSHGTLSFSGATASSGSTDITPGGTITYTPAANFAGADSFTVQVSDFAASATRTISVNITISSSVNSTGPMVFERTRHTATMLPSGKVLVAGGEGTGGALTVAEDAVLNVAAPGVLANDTDQDNDGLTAALVSGPSHGLLTLQSNGSFTYTPTAQHNGPDSFSYKVNDGVIDSSAATVSITVTPVNDSPLANAQSVTAVLKDNGATANGGVDQSAPQTFVIDVGSPAITGQPQNLLVSPTYNTTLSVTATGFAPLLYQWRKDGSAIPGATSSSYLINNLQFSHVGTYSVIVNNVWGSVTSSDATLTVDAYNITTLAGQSSAGWSDGQGSAARFNNPFGVAVDSSGNVYVADFGNSKYGRLRLAGWSAHCPEAIATHVAWPWTAAATSMSRIRATNQSSRVG